MIITSNLTNQTFRDLEGHDYNFIHNNFKNEVIISEDNFLNDELKIENSKVVYLKFPLFRFDDTISTSYYDAYMNLDFRLVKGNNQIINI